MATTTTYGLNKPTVGGDENTWGGLTNDNWDDVDDLLDGTTPITPNLGAGWEVGGVAVTATAAELNILDGVTASTAELNILDGVTASTAELNILDGVTASTAEINLLDGVTTLSGADGVLVTGTAGTSGQVAQWNADGDVVGYTLPTLVTATWEVGTDTTESLVSPAKVKAADAAFRNANDVGWSQTWEESIGRIPGTAYQNTTGKPIMVSIAAGTSSAVQVSANGSTWIDLNTIGVDPSESGIAFIVPNTHYYRLNGGVIRQWRELR